MRASGNPEAGTDGAHHRLTGWRFRKGRAQRGPGKPRSVDQVGYMPVAAISVAHRGDLPACINVNPGANNDCAPLGRIGRNFMFRAGTDHCRAASRDSPSPKSGKRRPIRFCSGSSAPSAVTTVINSPFRIPGAPSLAVIFAGNASLSRCEAPFRRTAPVRPGIAFYRRTGTATTQAPGCQTAPVARRSSDPA